jgi:hypothetical protein
MQRGARTANSPGMAMASSVEIRFSPRMYLHAKRNANHDERVCAESYIIEEFISNSESSSFRRPRFSHPVDGNAKEA